MSGKTVPSDDTAQVETGGRKTVAEEVELIDLGRASERTRGSYSGFIIEPSSFPLRDF
ncbi:MAG: hypothetical protein ACREUG_16540 [Steroidobacteraceae bacterium]